MRELWLNGRWGALDFLMESIAKYRSFYSSFSVLITVAWSIVTFFYLPDSPQTAHFLSASEREFAALRPYRFQRTTQTKSWDRGQFLEALKDVKSWWFFLFSLVICVPNGGTTSVSITSH
jgi:hypothetical protein